MSPSVRAALLEYEEDALDIFHVGTRDLDYGVGSKVYVLAKVGCMALSLIKGIAHEFGQMRWPREEMRTYRPMYLF